MSTTSSPQNRKCRHSAGGAAISDLPKALFIPAARSSQKKEVAKWGDLYKEQHRGKFVPSPIPRRDHPDSDTNCANPEATKWRAS
jgi:hypothetical protein